MASNVLTTRLRPRKSTHFSNDRTAGEPTATTLVSNQAGPSNHLPSSKHSKASSSTRNRTVTDITEQLREDVLFYEALVASSKEHEAIRDHASTEAAVISDVLSRSSLDRFRCQEQMIQDWPGQASKKRSLQMKNIADFRAYLSKNNCPR